MKMRLILYYLTVMMVIIQVVLVFIRLIVFGEYISFLMIVFFLVLSIIVINVMFDVPNIEKVDNIESFKRFEELFNVVGIVKTPTRRIIFEDGKLIVKYKYAGELEVEFIKMPGLGVWGIGNIKYIRDLYNEIKRELYNVMIE